jgi:hypothetical protein
VFQFFHNEEVCWAVHVFKYTEQSRWNGVRVCFYCASAAVAMHGRG